MGRVLRFAAPEGNPDDIARERRIAQLTAEFKRHAKAGPMAVTKCMELQEQLRQEIAARSPDQVKRMERERGLCP